MARSIANGRVVLDVVGDENELAIGVVADVDVAVAAVNGAVNGVNDAFGFVGEGVNLVEESLPVAAAASEVGLNVLH